MIQATNTSFLIGYMGSGKTTIGKHLAKKLNRQFLDLDDEIEKVTQKSIANIFASFGEDKFREIEKDVLRSLTLNKKLIVATGGGTPAYHKNMQWMNENGSTIYLRLHPGILFHRLISEKNHRPLIADLHDLELFEFITENIKNRLLFYKEAKIIIDANQSVEVIGEEIIRNLNI
jgi:shikimate kinase